MSPLLHCGDITEFPKEAKIKQEMDCCGNKIREQDFALVVSLSEYFLLSSFHLKETPEISPGLNLVNE